MSESKHTNICMHWKNERNKIETRQFKLVPHQNVVKIKTSDEELDRFLNVTFI